MSSSYYNLYSIDLSAWNLTVASLKITMDTGIHTVDMSLNSTIADFNGYDEFMKDLTLMGKIKNLKGGDPAIKEAWDQLMTVMALKA